jgi:ATP-dependent exoDNAse (exonuclease V) alpha subunit
MLQGGGRRVRRGRLSGARHGHLRPGPPAPSSSEAEIGESRTLASLIWRLDHRQLNLSEQTAVILDEVGMTDDVDLVRLAAHVEAAGAKLILVGDHHQIGSVGPGGALGALVARHPNAVHHLMENRRQHDPEERQALAALRDGEVAEAISFYVEHDRIHAKAIRGRRLAGGSGRLERRCRSRA